jgi:hypothetical protein
MKRGLSYALAVILTAGTFFCFGWSAPESAHAATGDIVAAGSITTGDIIYYGNYPQTDLGTSEPEGASGVDWVKEGSKYFKIEPLAWRVMENASGKLFLLSEKAIDCKPYNRDGGSITWETCTARSWLNGYDASENTNGVDYSAAGTNFIGNAFSAAEQGFIPTTDVDNPLYNTDSGGVNTNDKIFYLKVADVDNNVSYGFTTNSSRIAPATGYAEAMGAYVDSSAYWWLRSPGIYAYRAAYVNYIGGLLTGGDSTSATYYAARPAFYLETSGLIFRETGATNEYQASIPSTDATISGLSVSPGTLSPAFASGTEDYTVSVPNATDSITLTATTTDTNATVTGDGVKSLNVGENKFEITVIAEDGIAEKTYTVTVTRAASTDATLSNLSVNPGTLSPAFSSGTEEYTVSVPNATDSITLTATKADANASVAGDGVKSLNVGANTFKITVTAQDGIMTKTYTVTVTRAAPDKTANDDEDDDSDDEDFDTDEDDEDSDDDDGVIDGDDSDSGITSQPKTGDDISALWLVSLLASAALITLLMVLFIRRKAIKSH